MLTWGFWRNPGSRPRASPKPAPSTRGNVSHFRGNGGSFSSCSGTSEDFSSVATVPIGTGFGSSAGAAGAAAAFFAGGLGTAAGACCLQFGPRQAAGAGADEIPSHARTLSRGRAWAMIGTRRRSKAKTTIIKAVPMTALNCRSKPLEIIRSLSFFGLSNRARW